MRTGIAQAPLHGGHCPPWLFKKMKELAAVMVQVMIYEYGPVEVIRRLSDPVWFQTFGCVLGFDWHSSGLTTVVCGALKEGLGNLQGELGLFFAGGKGKVSRKTPSEIMEAGEKYGLSNDLTELKNVSRLVAKVDSAAVQDGYQLYHHFFIFDREGNWSVIQQGMNEENRYARRYHWLSDGLISFVRNPHRGICGIRREGVLNLTALENEATRRASVELCYEKPEKIIDTYKRIVSNSEGQPQKPHQLSLWEKEEKESKEDYIKLDMPGFHKIPAVNYLNKILYRIYEKPPESFQNLLGLPGVGAGTMRALTMVSEVTHGVAPSFQDPVRYTFAHGGKDGYPFPVKRKDLEHSISVLRTAVEKAKLGRTEKLKALRRLAGKEEQLIKNI